MLLPSFVSPLDETGALSLANVGKDVVLSDVYGLPPAFAYLAFKYSQNGNLNNAWPPSTAETALWLAAVALASTASTWLPLLKLRGGSSFATAPVHWRRSSSSSSALLRARQPRPVAMALWPRDYRADDQEEDDEDDFGFGSDLYDGPLAEAERDVMYLGPLLFAALSWLLLSAKDLPLMPRNENIFSWVPWLILLALCWDLPSEVRRGRDD